MIFNSFDFAESMNSSKEEINRTEVCIVYMFLFSFSFVYKSNVYNFLLLQISTGTKSDIEKIFKVVIKKV